MFIHLHTLHLHFGSSQVLIYSLNFRNDVSDLIFDGRMFHIFGPRDLKGILMQIWKSPYMFLLI